MDSRERVLMAMAKEKPDRVPVNFRATDQVIQRLAASLYTDYFGILNHYKIDFREVIPPYIGPIFDDLKDGSRIDLWGVGRKEVQTDDGRDVLISHNPLAQASTVEEVENHNWPQPEWFDYEPLASWCNSFQGFAISTPGLHLEGYHGVFHQLTYLFGMEKAMMHLVERPDLIEAAIKKIMEFFAAYYDRFFSAAPGMLDFLFYKDDFGGQRNLLISKPMFNQYFAPTIKTLADLARSHGARLILHSCGAVMKLIPDFIQAGVTVLDPIQVTAKGMDIRVLAKEYGSDLTFHGGIDVQRLMPRGTEEEIRAAVRELVEVLGDNGGFFFSPSHRFQPDTPTSNIVTLYDEVFKVGRY